MKKISFLLLALASLCFAGLYAQVTIGVGEKPDNYSLLDLKENATGTATKGLHLPRLTNAQRNALTVSEKTVTQGLAIYNTETNCSEYWNGSKWVSLCLGTANISLTCEDGAAYVSTPLPADGLGKTCKMKPVDDPACVVPSGQPYQVYLTAGASYAYLEVDAMTSAFQLSFAENNSSNARLAVVRVVNNCSGEFQDFLFTQAGGTCPSAPNPVVTTLNDKLCWGGAAYAYVTNPQDGVAYVWENSGSIVHTGIAFQISRAGIYKVYAGLLGCGTPAEITITDGSGVSASPAPHILVNNDGIICASGNVTLTALGAATSGQPVYWFKNGVQQNVAPAPFLTISGADSAGEWYAVVSDGGANCASLPSNKLNIVYNENSTQPAAPVATINGNPIGTAGLLVCGGGTLKLKIENASAYAGLNPSYEWYANGVLVSKSENETMYIVPPESSNLVMSLTVRIPGLCPISVSSEDAVVIQGGTPATTQINNGEEVAYICSGNPAILIAANSSGASYEWVYNDIVISGATASTYSAAQTGKYSVRYSNASGCWSELSREITVLQSAALSMMWSLAPKAGTGATDDGVLDTEKTYAVTAVPNALSFEWTVTPAGAATITKLGDGSTAVVKYGSTPTANVVITVTAENACGSSSIDSDPITVRSGCIPLSSLAISPATAQIVTQEKTALTFSATAASGSPVSGYEWFVDNLSVAGGSSASIQTYTTVANLGVGTHTIYAKIYNCDSNGSNASNPAKQTPVASIYVELDPTLAPLPPAGTDPYFYGSKTCLDVRQTDGPAFVQQYPVSDDQNPWKGGRLPKTVRPDDFRSGNAFAYTFGGNNINASTIKYAVVDPNNVIKSVSGDGGVVGTITFVDNIVALATGKTKASALRVVLYTNFNTSAGGPYKDSLVITVQDGACGCPAQISSGAYKMDLCHGAGGNYNEDPFVMTPSVYGAYYKWGNKIPAATWSTQNLNRTTSQSGTTWATNQNPCPRGWLPMTGGELSYFAGSGGRYAIQSQNSDGYRGQLRGMVPVSGGGYRVYAAGDAYVGGILEPDNCHTWSGNATSSGNANNEYFYRTGAGDAGGNYTKNYAEHVRCVQEGNSYGSSGY